MAMAAANDQAITQREKEINEIAKSIVTLAEIFRELQTMVSFLTIQYSHSQLLKHLRFS